MPKFCVFFGPAPQIKKSHASLFVIQFKITSNVEALLTF